jgi:hypothetical protein
VALAERAQAMSNLRPSKRPAHALSKMAIGLTKVAAAQIETQRALPRPRSGIGRRSLYTAPIPSKTSFRAGTLTRKRGCVLIPATPSCLPPGLGHRRKLLDAIAALRNDASGKAPSVDGATTSSAPSAHPEDRAERRQVTVMFSAK